MGGGDWPTLGRAARCRASWTPIRCLPARLQVATRRSRIAQKDVREIFFGELREAGVVNGYVAGIEEEQEEEFDPTKEAQER